MEKHIEIRNAAPELFIRAMFGGFTNQFGWLFFAFGMVFFWVFSSMVDFTDLIYFSGKLRNATGQVIKVEDTNAEVNDNTIQRITFSFTNPDNKSTKMAETQPGKNSNLIVSECYETGTSYKSGQSVQVEFPDKKPEIARIVGTRRGIFPYWVLFLVAIFPALGIGFIFFGIRRGLLIKSLLDHSFLTQGVLAGKEPTNTRINKKPVMKLTFSFETRDGQPAYVVARTHDYKHLVDEAEEPLLYNPYNPKESCLLDDIPGRPRLDEKGRLVPTEKETIAKTLLLPIIALIVNVLGVLLRFQLMII
ncbi:MAG: hypothetical protein Kow0029_09590 [Candidatus Rifleibacteriota bacterium]